MKDWEKLIETLYDTHRSPTHHLADVLADPEHRLSGGLASSADILFTTALPQNSLMHEEQVVSLKLTNGTAITAPLIPMAWKIEAKEGPAAKGSWVIPLAQISEFEVVFSSNASEPPAGLRLPTPPTVGKVGAMSSAALGMNGAPVLSHSAGIAPAAAAKLMDLAVCSGSLDRCRFPSTIYLINYYHIWTVFLK